MMLFDDGLFCPEIESLILHHCLSHNMDLFFTTEGAKESVLEPLLQRASSEPWAEGGRGSEDYASAIEPFLGWAFLDGRDYNGRQLKDMSDHQVMLEAIKSGKIEGQNDLCNFIRKI